MTEGTETYTGDTYKLLGDKLKRFVRRERKSFQREGIQMNMIGRGKWKMRNNGELEKEREEKRERKW